MNHVFTGVNMHVAHRGMLWALENKKIKLNKGDAAIFINRAWTAVKIMTSNNAFIYIREPRPFSVDMLINFPRLVGAKPLHLTQAQYNELERNHPAPKQRIAA